jgi:hypothetical protein
MKLVCDFAALAALFALAANLEAAPPRITKLSVRGFQAGGTTRVSLQGTNLDGDAKLVLGAPVKSQERVGKSTATAAEFDVTLDPAVPTGVYHLRVRTADGLSPAELVTIDGLPQQAAATNAATAIAKIPAAVHGSLSGAAVQEINFTGKQGETITVDVLAARFGSKLRPVVHLYDTERRQLAWSPPQTALAGDARVTVTLPADGKYTVAVHDLAYAAPTPGHFRVAIGALDYVDQVFPPVVAATASAPLELIGRFSREATTTLSATAAAKILAANNSPLGNDRPLPWPGKSAAVGLRPHVALSDLPELIEGATLADSRALPSPPVAVSGRLSQPGEVDLYYLELAASEKVQVEVVADRYGSPLDASLEVRDAKGARLAQSDDVVGPDPRLEYTAPKEGAKVTLVVSDALRRGGADGIYRLVVTRLDDAAPRADFRLTVADDTHNVPRGGSKLLRVAVERRGYGGAIRLSVAGLPAGLTAAPVEIPAGGDGALIEIRQTGKESGESFAVTVVGETNGAKPALVRRAESSIHPLARLQPWLAGESAAAVMGTAAPLAVAWDAAAAADSAKLYLGTDDKFVVQLQRDPAAKGAVRLSLLTTQPTPAGLNANQAAQQMLRGVAATVDVKPDAKKPTAEFAVRIPADLRQADYDVALKAELLSADGKTVVAEAYTTPRRLSAAVPIEVKPDAVKPVTMAKGPTAVALTGELKRLQGYAGDVTLTLTGLPKEATPVQPLVLKAKDAKYKLEFRLPPTYAAARLDGLKLVAAITPDNRRANNAGSTEIVLPPIEIIGSAAPSANANPAAAAKPARTKPAK